MTRPSSRSERNAAFMKQAEQMFEEIRRLVRPKPSGESFLKSPSFAEAGGTTANQWPAQDTGQEK